ncbi:MAG: hypothetical protein NTW96_25820 [Planctomycetia bacterium]|nr:hypothetical protein [Planctomycetia bacterium]
MSRHLVALVAQYETFDDEGRSFHHGVIVYSGFVLSLHNRWFWVTAGHCLRNNYAITEDEKGLDDLLAAGRIKLISTGFADYFGLEAPHRHCVPFSYEPGCTIHLHRKDLGLDFALIPLPDLVRIAFEKNRIIAISRKNWIHQTRVTFTHFKILGFPSHLVQTSKSSDDELVAEFQPVMFAVDALNPTDVEGVPSDIWFVGRIPPEVKIQDIKGMSGGPIYGLRKSETGQWFYHVIALQSWWRDKSRTIFGCSLPAFAEALHGIMNGS